MSQSYAIFPIAVPSSTEADPATVRRCIDPADATADAIVVNMLQMAREQHVDVERLARRFFVHCPPKQGKRGRRRKLDVSEAVRLILQGSVADWTGLFVKMKVPIPRRRGLEEAVRLRLKRRGGVAITDGHFILTGADLHLIAGQANRADRHPEPGKLPDLSTHKLDIGQADGSTSRGIYPSEWTRSTGPGWMPTGPVATGTTHRRGRP